MHYILANEGLFKGNKIKSLEAVKSVFEGAGIEYKVIFTHEKSDVTNATQEITSNGEENTVVVMGGDGTLHLVINAFKDFDKCALGLIPFGTGNDFACGAGVPADVKEAAEIIAYNKPRYIDFIELSSGLRSINSVGMGIDVDVLKRTYASDNTGKGKYLMALITSLKEFESINFTVKYDGKEEKHFGLIAALGNGPLFGGGIKMFPEAKIDDGWLELAIVDFISKPKIIGAFTKLMAGKANKIKKATFIRTKAATFIPESENFTIQAEGELYDNVQIDAHIVENKLKFYLP